MHSAFLFFGRVFVHLDVENASTAQIHAIMKIIVCYISAITLLSCLFLVFLCRTVAQGILILLIALASVITFSSCLDDDI